MTRILLISTAADVHLRYVERHISRRSDVLRIDPVDIIKGKSIDYVFENGAMHVLYKGHSLDDVRSVWYRRPSLFKPDDMPVKEDEQAYAYSSLANHINALIHVLPHAFWMSDVTAIRRASSKPLQLMMASKLGMNVPETLFATDPARARQFVSKHKTVIAKVQATNFPSMKLSFAKLIQHDSNIVYDGLRVDPYIFQQFIDPAFELRVTVVGDEVFAATVEGLEADGKQSIFRDWRYGHVNDTFKASAFDLPTKVAKQCVALVKEFGLAFGAMDIIVDKQGAYWFIENNPNGQWAFIEEITGQPIGKAIARMLESGPPNRRSL